MPRLHEPDLAVGPVQRAEHAVDAVAGVAEDVAHAPLMQALHDEVADGLGHGTARRKRDTAGRTVEFAGCSKTLDSLTNVGRSIADDLASGGLRVQLYFGGCRP